MTRLTPLGWITGIEGVLLCLVPAWQAVPLAAAGGVAMLAGLAGARLLGPRALTGLTATWGLPTATHAGVETTLTAHLGAAHGAPPLELWAWDPRARAQRRVARLVGAGATGSAVRWTTRFPARGAVALPPLEVTTVQPLGLMTCRRLVGDGAYLIVLPPLGRVRAAMRARLSEWFAGLTAAPEPGGDDLGRLRGWVAGDARSRIHWRASARHRQLLVAERHAPAARRLALVIDPQASAWVYERLVSAAATLVDDLGRRGWELTVHHGQAPRGLPGARGRLLEALALCRTGGSPLDEVVPRGQPCLALLDDGTPAPQVHPAPLVVRDGELPRLIHLPRRLGRPTS